uniref:Uncharacterized protein n=1 Tax=Angiostrongylus cantonensis TaxID=6313 RepID=A0A0K0DDQ2_ANGCA
MVRIWCGCGDWMVELSSRFGATLFTAWEKSSGWA